MTDGSRTTGEDEGVIRPRNKSFFVWGLIGAILLAAVIAWFFLARGGGAPASEQKLRVGYQTSPAMALIMVAQDRKLFEQAGADVDLREFTAGKFALQAFLGGSLDVAVAGDMPTGLALLQGQKLAAFAEVIRNSTDEMRMVVRRDGPCDPNGPERYFLSGRPKKIATSFGGGPEYFTVTFLRRAGVPLNRVTLISQTPAEMAGALAKGDVDAIAIFDPAATTAERMLAGAGCTFADPKVYRQHYIAVARPEAVGDKVDPRLKAFVRGLRLAEAYVADHPAEAKAIVQRKTSMDPETLDALWAKLDFGVTLDPKLPRLWMEQEDFHTSKPNASFPRPGPDFNAALTDRALN